MVQPDRPDSTSVRAHVEAVLASKGFSGSRRLSKFLRYIVEAQLDGRGDEIKERSIGIEVFERGQSFDPARDNIVRMEASRLRHKLREYYDTAGQNDLLRIEVPKGTYAPSFRYAEPPRLEKAATPSGAPARRTPRVRYGVLAFAAVLIITGAAVMPVVRLRAHNPSPDVTALYRKGRESWNQRTVDSLKKSIELYKEAIRREPDYGDAWAGLADSYAVLVGNDYPDSGLYVSDGVAAARRAIELNPRAGHPHAALASFQRYEMNFNAAERENRIAIELSPNDATLHQWYGHLLMFEHRYKEALAQLSAAERLDPTQPIIRVNLGEVYFWMGDLDRALDCYNDVLKHDPKSIAAAIGVESVQIARHQYAAALDHANRWLTVFPDDPGLNADRRVCLQALGRKDDRASKAN